MTADAAAKRASGLPTASVPFSTQDKADAIRRELKLRRNVYPRFVASGTMTQRDADRQIAVMAAILADYEIGSLI